jgi:hypothetical protein
MIPCRILSNFTASTALFLLPGVGSYQTDLCGNMWIQSPNLETAKTDPHTLGQSLARLKRLRRP